MKNETPPIAKNNFFSWNSNIISPTNPQNNASNIYIYQTSY